MYDIYKCADEGEMCLLHNKPAIVAYGADNHYFFQNFGAISSVPCSSDNFGDPAPGKSKQCYIKELTNTDTNISNVPTGFTKCADHNDICFTHNNIPADIVYGADGKYTSGFLMPGQSVICNSTFFPHANAGAGAGECYIKSNPNLQMHSTLFPFSGPSSTPNPLPTTHYSDTLIAPNCLSTSKILVSQNKKFMLKILETGNILFTEFREHTRKWISGDNKMIQNPEYILCMQNDGNLVLHNGVGEIFWTSNTANKSNLQHKLVVENTGTLSIYSGNQIIWSKSLNHPNQPCPALGPTRAQAPIQAPTPSHLPKGSWSKSCINPTMQINQGTTSTNTLLSATCKTIDGQLKNTVIDVSKCQPNTIWNNNGRLDCIAGLNSGFCTTQGNYIM